MSLKYLTEVVGTRIQSADSLVTKEYWSQAPSIRLPSTLSTVKVTG